VLHEKMNLEEEVQALASEMSKSQRAIVKSLLEKVLQVAKRLDS
jgi:hypothetical protein